MNISFKVTPSQKETIKLRMAENGFDEISAYIKIVALKMQAFIIVYPDSSTQEDSEELSFNVSEAQNTRIQENMKATGSKDLNVYLKYVALHGVVTALVEVRSTGDLDEMLKRITDKRKKPTVNPLFSSF